MSEAGWVRIIASACACAAIAGCGSGGSDGTTTAPAAAAGAGTTTSTPTGTTPGSTTTTATGTTTNPATGKPAPATKTGTFSAKDAPAIEKALSAASPKKARPFQPSPTAKPVHLPAKVVAKVRDQVITKAMFDKEITESQKAGGTPFDPSRCIAAMEKRSPKKRPSRESLRKQCAQLHATQVTTVMTKLLTKAQDAQAAKHPAAAGVPKISEAKIRAYFDQHKAQYSMAEIRGLQMVTAKSEAAAKVAKRKLAKSKPVETYSTTRAGQAPALGKLIFSLAKGAIGGPIKEGDVWYVVRVLRITAPVGADYAKRHDEILEQLQTQDSSGQQRVRTWQVDHTVCRAGYVISLCSNADLRSDAEIRKSAKQLAKAKQLLKEMQRKQGSSAK